MKKTVFILGILFSLGLTTSFAQSAAGTQPASSSRGEVLSTGTQAISVPADSSAVILSGQKDAIPAGSAPSETGDKDSGQPATSVRKPD